MGRQYVGAYTKKNLRDIPKIIHQTLWHKWRLKYICSYEQNIIGGYRLPTHLSVLYPNIKVYEKHHGTGRVSYVLRFYSDLAVPRYRPYYERKFKPAELLRQFELVHGENFAIKFQHLAGHTFTVSTKPNGFGCKCEKKVSFIPAGEMRQCITCGCSESDIQTLLQKALDDAKDELDEAKREFNEAKHEFHKADDSYCAIWHSPQWKLGEPFKPATEQDRRRQREFGEMLKPAYKSVFKPATERATRRRHQTRQRNAPVPSTSEKLSKVGAERAKRKSSAHAPTAPKPENHSEGGAKPDNAPVPSTPENLSEDGPERAKRKSSAHAPPVSKPENHSEDGSGGDTTNCSSPVHATPPSTTENLSEGDAVSECGPEQPFLGHTMHDNESDSESEPCCRRDCLSRLTHALWRCCCQCRTRRKTD